MFVCVLRGVTYLLLFFLPCADLARLRTTHREMGCCSSSDSSSTVGVNGSPQKHIGDVWLSESKSGKATTASRSTVPGSSAWLSNDNLSNQPAYGSPWFDPVKPFQDFSDDGSQGSAMLSETVDLHEDTCRAPSGSDDAESLQLRRHISLVGAQCTEPKDPQWWTQKRDVSFKPPPCADERNYHQDDDTNDRRNPTSIRVVWQVRKWLAGVEQPLRRGYVE